MYYNKKRTKTVALLGVILLLGICGCDTEGTVQEAQKQENVAGTVTEAVVKETAGITQAVTEEEEGITGEEKTTEAVEEEPEVSDMLKKMESEELELHVLTNAEGVYFNSGGRG